MFWELQDQIDPVRHLMQSLLTVSVYPGLHITHRVISISSKNIQFLFEAKTHYLLLLKAYLSKQVIHTEEDQQFLQFFGQGVQTLLI